ncbi:MAG TPA: response regulator [Gemmataceae bacterium]|jgi:two-component system OmpR family response regulator|nr:response regulator [Gemmataceae bacterium]
MTPFSVLVVDDKPDTAQTTADVLNLLGFQARAAVTPLDAIREAAADPPNAVLLDLGLPGLSGYDLARHLRETIPERPLLVAYTGRQGTESRARDAGFDLHVLKPADPVDLAELLRTEMGRRTGPAVEAS